MPQFTELAIIQRGNISVDPILAREAPARWNGCSYRRANVDLCQAFVVSPMAPQLKVLTLIEPAGAKVLARAKLDRHTIQLLDEAFGQVDRVSYWHG